MKHRFSESTPFASGLLLFVFACAHGPSPAEQGLLGEPATPAHQPPSEVLQEPVAPSAAPGPTLIDSGPAVRPVQRCDSLIDEHRIKRAAVAEVVAAGLGRWLQGVQVERVLEGRKFQGWRIGVLHLESSCYAAVDLRPGDVVTSINGQGARSLERPESAADLFASLAKAPAIEVTFLRQGKPSTIRFEIEGVRQP